jgi:adenylylsulfate reductase subunit A
MEVSVDGDNFVDYLDLCKKNRAELVFIQSKKDQRLRIHDFEVLLDKKPQQPIKVFFSYSHKDTDFINRLSVHLAPLRRNEKIEVSDKQISEFKKTIFQPLENYQVGRNEIVGGTVSPSYLLPIQGLQRLEKVMDEYVGGISVNYMTNDKLLERGIELLNIMEEDFEHIGAEDLHQLMRAWELKHRLLTSQSVAQHTLYREETRWPGYYYRGDHLKLDDENWHCLTLSQRDRQTGEWTMEKAPVYHIVD